MTVHGIIRGKIIELEERLPIPDGETVAIDVHAVKPASAPGTAAALLAAIGRPPRLLDGDAEALEFAIREGALPLAAGVSFDAEG